MRSARVRLDGGKPIREVLKSSRITLQEVERRSKDIDPRGKGVSFQLVAFLASEESWGRDTTSPRSAQLIAAALGVPEDRLFASESVRTRKGSA